MNKKWLIVISCAVVVLMAALIGYVFWPVESQTDTESQAMQAQVSRKNSEGSPVAIDEPGLVSQPTDSSEDREYARVTAYYQKIIKQNPDTPQAKRAKNLLREVTEHRRIAGEQPVQLASARPGKPQLKRSRPLRRRKIRLDTMDVSFNEIEDQN